MSDLLLSLWMALISADRFDLAGGHGSFVVTPFLALTPIVVASEVARRARMHRRITVSRSAFMYGLFACSLLCLVFFSAFRAIDFNVSAARATLLLLQLGGTFAVALLAADREDLMTTLARGAIAALIIFAMFDVAESLYWIGRGPELWRLGTLTARFDDVQIISIFPRLPGAVGDANRTGFLLVFYIFVIGRSRLTPLMTRGAIAVCLIYLLLTVSRSATMDAAVAGVATLIMARRQLSLRWLAMTMLVVSSALVVMLVRPELPTRIGDAVDKTISSRFSTNEGSAQTHVELIERGLQEGLESNPRAAFGVGYGNSYLVLTDILGNSKYANFHSLYVTMFVEVGVAALVLMLIITIWPIAAGSQWRAPLAGAIVFNIFYQTAAEPVFWLLLALAWLAIPERFAERTVWVGMDGTADPSLRSG